MDNIVFLAPLPAFQKRTRLAKMARVMRAKGIGLTLLGWERRSGELQTLKSSDPKIDERSILKGGGYVSATARAMYPLWMLLVFWHVLKLGRERTLFCLGWETAFPARLAAGITGARVVFDDADRFSMLIRLPAPLQLLLVALEHWTSKNCFLHIVPGWSRYEWRNANMVVIRNTPLREDLESARASAPKRANADLVIYVNGWINWDTGSPVFLQALDLMAKAGLKTVMNVAGRVVSESGEALVRHPNVVFHGELPQREALALYPASDVVLTYYDPKVAINAHAESNKWGDCVYFGTPFVVNSEVRTAQVFADAGAAWQVPYQDVEGLVRCLTRLAKEPSLLREAQRALGTLHDFFPPYDTQLDVLLLRLDRP